MLEKENLTPFQIQLLLYYLTAEPSKRTVTDSARSLNVSKWVVTRTLDCHVPVHRLVSLDPGRDCAGGLSDRGNRDSNCDIQMQRG